MTNEEKINDLIRFWKKCQRLNASVLKRIAIKTETNTLMLAEMAAKIHNKEFEKVIVWYNQQAKLIRQSLDDLIFAEYGELDILDLLKDEEK